MARAGSFGRDQEKIDLTWLKRHGRAMEQDVLAKISELRRLMPDGVEASPHTSEQIQVVKSWKEGS